MKLKRILKYGVRFLLLQTLLTAVTIYYFDNFLIGDYINGFNIIVDNLLEDRLRFYEFVPKSFIKIDIYLALFIFVFLLLLYNSKNYSMVNDLDLASNKSIVDEYFYIFLIWSTCLLSFLQIFRFSSVSRLYTLLFTLIIPFLLVLFRNSELISSILGRNPSDENFLAFGLEENSIFRELRILTFRNQLKNFQYEDNFDENLIMERIEDSTKNNKVNIVVINLNNISKISSNFEMYLLNLNKKILLITENSLKFNNNFIFRHKILSKRNLYYINNDIQYGSNYILKRIFDISISLVLFFLLLPIFLIVILAILINDGAPVINEQTRVGLHGKNFKLYKFRTMERDAHKQREDLSSMNEKSGPLFKMSKDPRFIKGAKFLRKYSLDELPQIINVLKGDMSLVGPRPLFPEDNFFYDHNYLRRLNVLPGITGLLQINERNTSSFETWYKYDLEYIENWNLFLDFKILLTTMFVIFKKDMRGK